MKALLAPVRFLARQGDVHWDAVSACIGGAAALVAILTIRHGIRSYRDNARAIRLGHMHKLFGDYLAHELNYQISRKRGARRPGVEASLNAFKMYTLEEMWLWLEKEKREPVRGEAERKDRQRLLQGWGSTIGYHLGKTSDSGLADFVLHRECYSPQFVALVLGHDSNRALFRRRTEDTDSEYEGWVRGLLKAKGSVSMAAGGEGAPGGAEPDPAVLRAQPGSAGLRI